MWEVVRAVMLFAAAGLAEIGGGWLMWQWLREGRPWPWGVAGAVSAPPGNAECRKRLAERALADRLGEPGESARGSERERHTHRSPHLKKILPLPRHSEDPWIVIPPSIQVAVALRCNHRYALGRDRR